MKLHSGLSGLLYYRDNNYFTFVIYQIFVINFNKAMRQEITQHMRKT